MQTSETFLLGALLSFSGGLQDAYTYNIRGQVFANAQTGNVVLMSQSFMSGHFANALHYMLPLIAFAFGVLIAERIEFRFKKSRTLHWRQIILGLETAILTLVGFLPENLNILANILVSFSCALQVQTFRKVHGYGYASTMCIGNLRSGIESFSKYLRTHHQKTLFKSFHFFAIILIFALGAGIGGILTGIIGTETIWISSGILIIVTLMMHKETRSIL